MLNLSFEALDDWQNIIRFTHWDIKLIVWGFPTAELEFLEANI
jgi:hypothetical protein